MAYYSFYKIIKDLIFTIYRFLKKSSYRVLTIIIIFLIVFCLFSFKNKSSAHVSFFNDINNFINTNVQSGTSWALYYGYDDNIYLCSASNHNWLLSTSGDVIIYSPSNSQNNIIQCYYYKMNEDYTFTQVAYDYGYNLSSTYAKVVEMIDINDNIYVLNNSSAYSYNVSDFLQPIDLNKNPFIVNESITIENWSFDNLNINGGNISPYFELNSNNYPYLFNLKIIYNNVSYDLDIVDYVTINENNNTFNISIPKAYLTTSFNVVENSNFSFILEMKSFDINGDINNTINYNLGDYFFILTSSQVEEQNNNSQRFLNVLNNNNLNNINNNINNSNVNNNNIDSFNNINDNMFINDNTSIDTIFNNIYNAFTTKYNDNNVGYGYTLQLPIPYTDKTIDISPHTIFGRDWADLYEDENQYNYPGVQIIYRFVQTIWWFVIGSFVLKDVRSIINKIAEGNIEDVSSDVEKELL